MSRELEKNTGGFEDGWMDVERMDGLMGKWIGGLDWTVLCSGTFQS